MRDNDTPVVIVRATGGGVIDIEARVDGAETKRARYSVAVADSLFWSPSTDGADATGCPASITSPETFPIVVMRRAGTVPLWFPQTKTAIASVCVTRSGDMPACHDVRRDARGVVEVGAAEVMRRGGPGAYEVTVAYDTYDAKPLRCATVLK